MKPVLLLRIASVLSLIHCALHTVGGVFGRPRHGAEEIAVIETMKSHRFALLFFSWIATAIVSGGYFFAAPAVTELLIAACLAVAFFTAASA